MLFLVVFMLFGARGMGTRPLKLRAVASRAARIAPAPAPRLGASSSRGRGAERAEQAERAERTGSARSEAP